MSQLENFRSALKRGNKPDDTVSSGQTADRKEDNKSVPGSTSSKGSESKTEQHKMKRTSIGLPGEVHEKLKVISLWMKKVGIRDNPGLVAAINELMDFYIKQHPSAEKFLEIYYGIE